MDKVITDMRLDSSTSSVNTTNTSTSVNATTNTTATTKTNTTTATNATNASTETNASEGNALSEIGENLLFGIGENVDNELRKRINYLDLKVSELLELPMTVNYQRL